MSGPPVQRLGTALLLQGPAVSACYLAAAATVAELERKGSPPPACLRELLAAARTAARQHDAAPAAPPAHSKQAVGTAEAARLLGRDQRTAQRLARSLEGTKRGGRWRFDRQAVLDYAAMRDTNGSTGGTRT